LLRLQINVPIVVEDISERDNTFNEGNEDKRGISLILFSLRYNFSIDDERDRKCKIIVITIESFQICTFFDPRMKLKKILS